MRYGKNVIKKDHKQNKYQHKKIGAKSDMKKIKIKWWGMKLKKKIYQWKNLKISKKQQSNLI